MAAMGGTEMAHAHSPEELRNVDTAHEPSDVNIRAIIWFVVVLSVTAALIHTSMYGLFVLLDKLERQNDPAVSPVALPTGEAPLGPLLQTTPWADLKRLRSEETQYLHSYGWIDQKAGVARIPIDKAKALLLQRGIPVRPEASDETEGTHAAAMGESNSGRTLPGAAQDKSAAPVPPTSPQATKADSNEPPKKPGGGL
jgi:hypothetical protein